MSFSVIRGEQREPFPPEGNEEMCLYINGWASGRPLQDLQKNNLTYAKAGDSISERSTSDRKTERTGHPTFPWRGSRNAGQRKVFEGGRLDTTTKALLMLFIVPSLGMGSRILR